MNQQPCDHGRRKNDAPNHSATLPINRHIVIMVIIVFVIMVLSPIKVFVLRDEAPYLSEALGFNLPRVVNQARAFRVGSGPGRTQAWILKNCLASIGPGAGAKWRLSVSDKVFAIAKKN